MKVLIIDETHPILIENLENKGYKVYQDADMSREKLLDSIHTYNALIIRSKIEIDREIIDRGENLICIARVGAGLDAIDIEYAEEKGIAVLNSPEGNRDAVAEHAMGMLLSLFNNLIRADAEVRDGLWKREENRGYELMGKTVGIIGYGNIGKAFAQRLSGFGVEVIAYDKYKEGYGDKYGKEVGLEEIFQESDIVSLHIPLSKENKYMVDYEFLSRFQKPIYLINTARGRVVRTKDLIRSIEEGKVLGACLDVIEYEAFSSELIRDESINKELTKLFSMKNIILSPHIAGWTFESHYKLANFLSQKIIKALESA